MEGITLLDLLDGKLCYCFHELLWERGEDASPFRSSALLMWSAADYRIMLTLENIGDFSVPKIEPFTMAH